MQMPISTENLTKVYNLGRKKGIKIAVDKLTIEVPEGGIFGFLGPNGAGKTTTIKMALNFVSPTEGSVKIFGKPACNADARQIVGYLPEQPYFHKFLKPIEVVSMHAALAGVPRSEIRSRSIKAIERAGIAEYAETRISKLSKGLTQRVGIAQAIVGDPKLLILDEPTSGLDPIGRRHTRDLLIELRNEGKTIFLSSHLLSEVESLCDKIAIMKDGKLVAYGTPDQVRSGTPEIKIQTAAIDNEMQDRLRFMGVNIEIKNEGTTIRINPENVYEVMRAMENLKLPIYRIETERESLEEAFLRLAA